ncbi:MAG: hypothetical protein ACI30R_10920 [Sodaliphilus sp.]
MKKATLFLATLAIFATLTSCGDDDNNPTGDITETIALPQISAKTVIDGKSVYDHDFDGAMVVNYGAQTLTLNLNKVKFAEKMPEVNFAIAEVKFKKEGDVFVLNSSQVVSNSSSYDVSALKGSIDAANKVYNISFRVNNTYDVILTGTFNCSKDFNTNSKYYTFSLTSKANEKALRLAICNVKFAEGMMPLKEMAVYLNSKESGSITSTSTGYTFECGEVIPFYKEGNTETPMESRPMNNVKGTVDLVNRTFSIEFDCYGLHYTDSSALYL